VIDPILFIGLVVFAGFAANLIFARTRISQVILLIAFGFLLGPILGLVPVAGPTSLASYVPLVGTLALIILVFDGGITLNVFELLKAIPQATGFTILVFLLSLAATAVLAVVALGWSPIWGLLLGSALAGTSFEVVWSMLEKTNIASHSKSLLVLESTFTDDLSIITTVTLLHLITTNTASSASIILGSVAGSFSVALVGGVIAAIIWIKALGNLDKKDFPYMLTLAVVFLLYAVMEQIGANGGIAVFTFALVLGNAKRGSKLLRLKEGYALNKDIVSIQSEVTFFTSTFFLVFLGLILNPNNLTVLLVAFAAALSILFVVLRWGAKKALLENDSHSSLLVTMLPRGLAAAVLAGLPATMGVAIPGFAEIALLVIVFTNVIATLGVFFNRPSAKQANQV
jgi:NhaP-type Na+/H+ or K+/H+ antiporter